MHVFLRNVFLFLIPILLQSCTVNMVMTETSGADDSVITTPTTTEEATTSLSIPVKPF